MKFADGRFKTWLDIVTSVVMIAGTIAIVWSNVIAGPKRPPVRKPPAVPSEPQSLTDVATKGSATAPMAVIEFSDFECPFCGQFARETLPKLDGQFIQSGKVQFAMRHLPLPMHANATKAAEIAECARRQDKFWLFYDKVYAAERPASSLESVDSSAGLLNRKDLQACLSQTDVAATVASDAALAKKLGISTTPTFLLGLRLPNGMIEIRQVLEGARSAEEFAHAIDELSSQVPRRRP